MERGGGGMTIQVAVMNGYGVAMASDRHVFRGTDARSTGQEVKLLRLRGVVPAAMMLAGPFAMFGLPAARLALRLERALDAAGSGAEVLAEAVLQALAEPFDGPVMESPAATASQTVDAVSRAPSSELYLMVGVVCPQTGVPALLSLRMCGGEANRLKVTSRLDAPYEVAWRAGRTVVTAQGTGRALVEAMVDGVAEEHWCGLAPAARKALRPAMEARWDRAHATLGVASPRELAAVASGLVRGAEVLGFLTREAEATVAEVDWILLTPREVLSDSLGPGPAQRVLA
jgi:hypothetical protein